MTTKLPLKYEPTLTSAKCRHKIHAGYTVLMISWILICFEGRIEHLLSKSVLYLDLPFCSLNVEKFPFFIFSSFQNNTGVLLNSSSLFALSFLHLVCFAQKTYVQQRYVFAC